MEAFVTFLTFMGFISTYGAAVYAGIKYQQRQERKKSQPQPVVTPS